MERNTPRLEEISFSFAHFNVRSLCTGFDSLSEFIGSSNYSVIGLSETWLDHSISSDIFNIPGYSLVTKDRETRGGGVAFYSYIKKCFNFSIVEVSTTADLEQLWLTNLLVLSVLSHIFFHFVENLVDINFVHYRRSLTVVRNIRSQFVQRFVAELLPMHLFDPPKAANALAPRGEQNESNTILGCKLLTFLNCGQRSAVERLQVRSLNHSIATTMSTS
nr:unnamed protein product [Callosobruchus chinensis]